MPLEGKLGSFNFSYETIVTDGHPAVTRSLFMDDTVTAKLPAGTILKSIVNKDEDQKEIDGAAYLACAETDTPAAVLVEDFDPADPAGKKYAMCLVHGCVKTEFLTVGGKKPKLAMLDKLQAMGIFAV